MNSRSSGGISTDIDHKMVIANVILDDYKIVRSKTKAEPKIDISSFTNVDNQNRYRNATEISDITVGHGAQEKWKILVEQCTEADAEISGKHEKAVKFNDPIFQKLSQLKIKTKLDISAAADVIQGMKSMKNSNLSRRKSENALLSTTKICSTTN